MNKKDKTVKDNEVIAQLQEQVKAQQAQLRTALTPQVAPSVRPKSALLWKGDYILVIGSTWKDQNGDLVPSTPKASKCDAARGGCGHDLVIVTSLPHKSAQKFTTCQPCFKKKGLAAWRARQVKQAEAMPPELKQLVEEANAIAAGQPK